MTTSRMHSGAVPTLSHPSETPADEWAKETEGAINEHSSSNATSRNQSNFTTPGYELPGAFPVDSTPEASPTSKDLGEVARQNVEGVYMTAHHGVEAFYSTAEQAARQYLPTSVVDKLEGVGVLRENPEYQEKPSLPTQESESNFAHTHGGIGSLPGSTDEVGVAILPEERKEEEENKARDPKIVTETGSHQSTYKASLLSTPSSSQVTTTQTPDSSPFPPDSSDTREDPHTTSNTSLNMNSSPKQPSSSNGETNAFENAHSTTKTSALLSSISRTGTLTSPDSDAQAAARVGRDTTGMSEEAPEGSRPGGQLNTSVESDAKKGGNGGTETKAEGSPALVNVPHTPGTQTMKNSDPSHDNDDGGGEKGNPAVGNGKGHTRKSSFVQKLKGEAKAFAEKVKTKTRG